MNLDNTREYFECDCHDPNHILKATHEIIMNNDDKIAFESLSLTFHTLLTDGEVYCLTKVR